MKITVVNFNPKAELEQTIEQLVAAIYSAAEEKSDFIVFPELAVPGYDYFIDDPACFNAGLLAKLNQRLSFLARSLGLYIAFGAPDYQDEKVYNATIILTPEGDQLSYHKIHLSGLEHRCFEKGAEPLLLETPFGKIGFGICFDTVAFPELIRYYASQGATLYINSYAMCGEDTTYLIRPLEYLVQSTGIYLASANLCGQIAANHYSGASCILGPIRKTEEPVHYYANEALTAAAGSFSSIITLSDNLRFIFDGNRFNPEVPDFRPELYYSWYDFSS